MAKLTKGGIYMLSKCDEKGRFLNEEIVLQISQVFGCKRFGNELYQRCLCQDGLGETATVYFEMIPAQPLLKKSETVIVNEFINDKKSDGHILILVVKFVISRPECPAPQNTPTVQIRQEDYVSDKYIQKKIRTSASEDDSQEDNQKTSSQNEIIQEPQPIVSHQDNKSFKNIEKPTISHQNNNNYSNSFKSIENNSRISHEKTTTITAEELNGHQQPQNIQYLLRKAAQDRSNKSYISATNDVEPSQLNVTSTGGPLSEKLNKPTLLVKDLKVGQNRLDYKFEGRVVEKSQVKYTKDQTKHFFIRAIDPANHYINISFWTGVDALYAKIEVDHSYYFIGGEVNRYSNEYTDSEVLSKDSLMINSVPNQVIPNGSSPNMSANDYSPNQNSSGNKNLNILFQNTNRGQIEKKKLGFKQNKPSSISEVLSTNEQYVSTVGIVKECHKMDSFYKITITDDRESAQLAILLFHELYKVWKDKIIVGNQYSFINFVRSMYNNQVQLKSNRSSSIESNESDQINVNPFNHNDNAYDKSDSKAPESISTMNRHTSSFVSAYQVYDHSRISNISEIIDKAEKNAEGDRSYFVVYANLISIQLNKKLFYYRCNGCNIKGSLKSHGDSFFCSTCSDFVTPSINLMLSAYIQDNTDTIPILLFHQQSCFLINDSDPSIPLDACGDFVKNCLDADKEDDLRKVFGRLDYRSYRFEIQAENKAFNQEKETSYTVQRIERKNPREESLYLLNLLQKELQGASAS